MSKKQIPPGIIHEPKPMAWAEMTPLSEHKQREANGINAEVIPTGTSKEPLPLSRATTDLRRAYPYIFDCAAYTKTHAPDNIDTDEFYSRFTMPYHVFLDYCLDGCTEQTQYLKEELYKLIKGQPSKYIKVSPERTVLAQPVIIAFSHTDLKTGKDKRITNIGQDAKVDLVQVQILKELLDVSHGYLNVPKAFYAKTRRAFNALKQANGLLNKSLLEHKDNHQETINAAKQHMANRGIKMSIKEAAGMIKSFQAQANQLKELEQGGYHAVYLAYEYIIANRSKKKREKNKKPQSYNFLKLCEKCAPELVRKIDGKLYFNEMPKVQAFMGTLVVFATLLSNEPALGISSILPSMEADGLSIEVEFI